MEMPKACDSRAWKQGGGGGRKGLWRRRARHGACHRSRRTRPRTRPSRAARAATAHTRPKTCTPPLDSPPATHVGLGRQVLPHFAGHAAEEGAALRGFGEVQRGGRVFGVKPGGGVGRGGRGVGPPRLAAPALPAPPTSSPTPAPASFPPAQQGGVAAQGDADGLKAQADAVDGEIVASAVGVCGQPQNLGSHIEKRLPGAQPGGATRDQKPVDRLKAALDLQGCRVEVEGWAGVLRSRRSVRLGRSCVGPHRRLPQPPALPAPHCSKLQPLDLNLAPRRRACRGERVRRARPPPPQT